MRLSWGVKCCYNIVGEILPHFIGHSFNDVNNWIKGKTTLRYGKEATALWRVMCNAKTIKENNLLFNPSLSLGEDTIFINTYFLYEKSIGYLDKCFYHLAQREDGANLSSVLNASKRIADKTKLITARQEIDLKAKQMCNIDTHQYWEGTLVFSGVEMALKMSHNQNMSYGANFSRYIDFLRIAAVRESYRKFRPTLGFKSLPFWIIKLCGPRIAFILYFLLPDKIVSKFVR